MTTDATSSWNPTLRQIVTGALLKVGAIDETEAPTADQFQSAVFTLNGMIKEWQASGIHVWTEEEAILFLQPLQYRYILGPGTTDHACPAFGWTQLTLSSAVAAGATSLPVVSASGINAGDNIGVVLDNNAVFWTTVSGAPAGNVITLSSALPSSASQGNYGFDYPVGTDIGRPLEVPAARALRYNGFNLTPMQMLSRQEYEDLPNPAIPGSPTQAFYAPKLSQGEFYIWNPVLFPGVWGIRFTWYRSIADLLIPGDTADFPQEWSSALTWNLAREEMLTYEVPPPRALEINKIAEEKLALVQGYDRENTPIHFGLDLWPR